MNKIRAMGERSTAWPFLEAKRIVKRFEKKPPQKGFVVFQTGYGPSGLPHIGTFGEVMRTTMVKQAFEVLSDIPSKLICFSDDMDGFRKVPTNVPNQKMLSEDLDLPLTKVRDPFGVYNSFGKYNNSKLCEFLDQFGFDYKFISATDYYCSGKFDEALKRVADCYDEIMGIMLPSLRSERQGTYSPFLPISPKTGKVLQVPILDLNVKKNTIAYKEPDGEKIEVPITGGGVKLQWKPDWAMRWFALEVDYEMFGKDLIPSAELASKICRNLGRPAPELLNYELFLDEGGQKISKSKGNGLSIEQWLTYADPKSLSLFMYQKPKTAKRLFFDVIPKMMDEYQQHLKKSRTQDSESLLSNPIWHIHGKAPEELEMPISFSMLLNLVSASGAENKETLWGFIQKYSESVNPRDNNNLDLAVGYALKYYDDFIKPKKMFKTPTNQEFQALLDLKHRLTSLDKNSDSETIQSLVFSVGKDNNFDPLRTWFLAIYEILFGTPDGPRLGSFISLYGVNETIQLIDISLDRSKNANFES